MRLSLAAWCHMHMLILSMTGEIAVPKPKPDMVMATPPLDGPFHACETVTTGASYLHRHGVTRRRDLTAWPRPGN